MTEHARMKLLDHGYVQLIETWGGDERIVEAARMSTGRGFEGWSDYRALGTSKCDYGIGPDIGVCRLGTANCKAEHPPGDEKLLEYLWDHKHATPFEMAGMVIEVQAPIFVFREWHRHRTQSYNEMSARYTPLPDLNYVPTVVRLMVNASGSNRQAGTVKGSDALTVATAVEFCSELEMMYDAAERSYQKALGQGIPKELARLIVPVGRYSRMRASANLRNWLAFLTLRCDDAAQFEIRQYANAVAQLVCTHFPRTHALWCEAP
jgi:thymidylate synthase (FAD)